MLARLNHIIAASGNPHRESEAKGVGMNGSLELIFTDFPFALRKWIMVDEQRQEYVFSISEFIRLSKLSDELFRLAEAVSDAPTSGMR